MAVFNCRERQCNLRSAQYCVERRGQTTATTSLLDILSSKSRQRTMLRRIKVGDDAHWSPPISIITSPSASASPCYDRPTRLRSKRSGRKHVSSEKSLVLKLGVCFLYVVALHNVVSTTFKCVSTRIPMNVLDAVSVACRTFFAAVTSHLYYKSYPDVARFLSRDRKLDPGLHQALKNSVAVRRKRWLALALVVGYGVAMVVHQCAWLYRYGPLVYFRSQLYGLDPVALRMRPSVVAFAAIVDFTAFNAAVLVPAFCMAHFVGICDLIVLKGNRFRNLLQAYCASGSDGLKVGTVRKLQGSYAALWEAAQYVDKRLRAALFFWYVDTVLNIVVSVRAVQHTLAHYNPYSASGAYVHAAYLTAAFLLVSLSAANLVAQRRHLLHGMCRLVCAIDGVEDDELCNQVMLLQEDVANGQLAFTGWNCFDIDRPFILSVMGAVITYSVVLQQLT